MSVDAVSCPSCGEPIRAQRFHAGFSNEGFLYAATGSLVLTWDAYDPGYLGVIDKHPWMLSPEEQAAVEAAIKPGIRGEPYRFANQPRCPTCDGELHDLAGPGREYFVVTGERLDAAAEAAWQH